MVPLREILSGVSWKDIGVEILSSALQKSPPDIWREAIAALHGEQPADVDQAPVEVASKSVLVNSKGKTPCGERRTCCSD